MTEIIIILLFTNFQASALPGLGCRREGNVVSSAKRTTATLQTPMLPKTLGPATRLLVSAKHLIQRCVSKVLIYNVLLLLSYNISLGKLVDKWIFDLVMLFSKSMLFNILAVMRVQTQAIFTSGEWV